MTFSAADEPAEHRGFLRQVAQPQARALIDAERGEVPLIEPDACRASAVTSPDDHVERRGLAGAVGTEQSHHLAGVDLERQILHHRARAVGFAELGGGQRAHGEGGPDAGPVGGAAGTAARPPCGLQPRWKVPRTRSWLAPAAGSMLLRLLSERL